MSNHSEFPFPEELSKRMEELYRNTPKLGATGNFPEGKISKDDEGEIQLRIMHEPGKVIIDFGTPVTWIGFNSDQAKQIALTLLKHAADCLIIERR